MKQTGNSVLRLSRGVMSRVPVVIAVAAVLTGCSLGIDLKPKEQVYYTLLERTEAAETAAQSRARASDAAQGGAAAETASLPVDLTLRETRANPFLSGRKIVFGESPQTRGYYQFASWVEPLPKRFAALLANELRVSARYRSVARSSLSARGDVELVTELVDCYHLTADPPGEAVITLDADLLETRTGTILAHHRFHQEVRSPTFDVEGAVSAMQSGVYSIIDQIEPWLEDAVAANISRLRSGAAAPSEPNVHSGAVD